MLFETQKQNLVKAVERIHEVATKGIRPEFKRAGLLTMSVADGQVTFLTTNGYLELRCTLDGDSEGGLQCGESATPVTVETDVFLGVLKSLGGAKANEHVIRVSVEDGGSIIVKDCTTRRKKTAEAKIIAKTTHHTLSFSKPKAAKDQCSFSWDLFEEGMTTVGRYMSNFANRQQFRMLCIDILPEEMRFVCGDGVRFAILSYPLEKSTTKSKAGTRYLLPVEQLLVLKKVFQGSDEIEFVFRDPQNCYVSSSNLRCEAFIKAIPQQKFISYERQMERVGEAVAIIDLKRADFQEGVELALSVRDTDSEEEGGNSTHSVEMRFSESGELDAKVDEGKYRCKYSCPIDFYRLADVPEYIGKYAWTYLNDIVRGANTEYIRFYITPVDREERKAEMLLVDLAELDSDADERGVPKLKDCGRRLLFFAASTAEMAKA